MSTTYPVGLVSKDGSQVASGECLDHSPLTSLESKVSDFIANHPWSECCSKEHNPLFFKYLISYPEEQRNAIALALTQFSEELKPKIISALVKYPLFPDLLIVLPKKERKNFIDLFLISSEKIKHELLTNSNSDLIHNLSLFSKEDISQLCNSEVFHTLKEFNKFLSKLEEASLTLEEKKEVIHLLTKLPVGLERKFAKILSLYIKDKKRFKLLMLVSAIREIITYREDGRTSVAENFLKGICSPYFRELIFRQIVSMKASEEVSSLAAKQKLLKSMNVKTEPIDPTGRSRYRINVSRQTLKEDVEQVLNQLSTALETKTRAAFQVQFINSEGEKEEAADGGGPSRELERDVFQNLVTKGKQVQFQLVAGCYRPKAQEETLSELEFSTYYQMGKYMMFCYSQNHHPEDEEYQLSCPIGQIFSREFYSVVFKMKNDCVSVISLQDIIDNYDYHVKLYKHAIKDDKEESAYIQQLETSCKEWELNPVETLENIWDEKEFPSFYLTNDEIDEKKIKANPTPLKKYIEKKVAKRAFQFLGPVSAITRGMEECRHASLLSLSDAEKFELQIQGRITVDSITARLKLSSVTPRLSDWIMRWLTQSSDEQRRNFLKVLTGASSLGPNDHLELLELSESEKYKIAWGTCNNQGYLPNSNLFNTYEDFEDFFNYEISQSKYNAL